MKYAIPFLVISLLATPSAHALGKHCSHGDQAEAVKQDLQKFIGRRGTLEVRKDGVLQGTSTCEINFLPEGVLGAELDLGSVLHFQVNHETSHGKAFASRDVISSSEVQLENDFDGTAYFSRVDCGLTNGGWGGIVPNSIYHRDNVAIITSNAVMLRSEYSCGIFSDYHTSEETCRFNPE